MDNLCANTQPRGDGGTGVFASPVNTKQACAFATNAQHKRFSRDIHAIILVRDAANKWRYYSLLAAPTRNLL